ncbi:MAG: AAA family ATPase, partial [Limnospira sp.]
ERTYRLNLKANIVPYYQDILEKLGRIMGGDIVMKSLEGISPIEFYFNFGKEGGDLPMYLASSSVNQLTLLNLYLKYWVEEKNNFLMMDEPEENVHPENQIKLLELLIQFATQNDNKVLITTHSPLMANAVNNYIYLDMLKNDYDCDVQRLVEEHNLKLIDTDTSISQDDVGVYFFNGKRIIDYEANDYGIYFRDFSSILESLDKSRRILNDSIDLQDAGDE